MIFQTMCGLIIAALLVLALLGRLELLVVLVPLSLLLAFAFARPCVHTKSTDFPVTKG